MGIECIPARALAGPDELLVADLHGGDLSSCPQKSLDDFLHVLLVLRVVVGDLLYIVVLDGKQDLQGKKNTALGGAM